MVNDTIRVVIGSLLGAVAMFLIGFIFWATPLAHIGFASLNETQSAAVQSALAQNVPGTGRYIVPNPETSGGTVLYGRGPVGTLDYNSGGFAVAAGPNMLGGFIQEFVVVLMIGFSLFAVAGRVTDFTSRARLAIGLTGAAVVMIELSDPLFMHGSWRYALYALVADFAMLWVPALIVARWFLPLSTATSADTTTLH